MVSRSCPVFRPLRPCWPVTFGFLVRKNSSGSLRVHSALSLFYGSSLLHKWCSLGPTHHLLLSSSLVFRDSDQSPSPTFFFCLKTVLERREGIKESTLLVLKGYLIGGDSNLYVTLWKSTADGKTKENGSLNFPWIRVRKNGGLK